MNEEPEIHLPQPSFWPILLAFGLGLICLGVIINLYVTIVGLIILLVSVGGWTLENRAEIKEKGHE